MDVPLRMFCKLFTKCNQNYKINIKYTTPQKIIETPKKNEFLISKKLEALAYHHKKIHMVFLLEISIIEDTQQYD